MKKDKDTEQGSESEGKLKALETALSEIRKSGTQVFCGSKGRMDDIGKFSTGLFTLDQALSGGMGKGTVVEIYGPEAGGKTSTCLHLVAQVQKMGGVAAYIDAEHALDPAYAATFGVDMDALLVCQPDSGEQAMDVTEKLVSSGAVSLVVVDSVAALTPQAEIEGEMGDSHVGLQARLMSQGLRKLNATISKTKTTVIFINQIRMKIGVMYGNPETTPGGLALKFYASQRLEVRSAAGDKFKDGDTVYGMDVKIKVIKNKIGMPYKSTAIPLIFGKGFDKSRDLANAAIASGVIKQSGASYSFGGEKLSLGLDKLYAALASNTDLTERVKTAMISPIENKTSEETK